MYVTQPIKSRNVFFKTTSKINTIDKDFFSQSILGSPEHGNKGMCHRDKQEES